MNRPTVRGILLPQKSISSDFSEDQRYFNKEGGFIMELIKEVFHLMNEFFLIAS